MDTSTYRVPPRVAALAQRQQLGALVAVHKGDHPLVECATGLVIAAVLFGAAAGVGWVVSLVEFLQIKVLALLVLLLAIGGLAAAGYAFFRLFGAHVVVHHYAHGLVWTRNRSVDAVPFSWIDEMYVTRKDAKATAAGLVTLDGRTVDVTGAEKPDYTAFVDRLEAELTARRRRILPARREVGREPAGVGISDRVIAVLAVIVGGALVAAIGVGLSRTGLPGPVAAVIGFLIIGVTVGLLGARFDSRIAVVGGIFAAVGGLVMMVAVGRLIPQVNKYVTATVVLAVEMGILSVVLNAYRRLPALPPTRTRKRLAARQGWEFLPSLTVAIPGPQSARQLIGVQEGAQSVELFDVVRGAVNGVPVLAGDRYRRKPRRSDPVQTVWMVPLASPVPYVSHTSLDTTGQSGIFTVTPPWWMEGSFLLCEGPGDPETIVAWASSLTRIATTMPWETIRARTPGSHSA
ncbi:hypothetical protein AB0K00_10765 [Dactylosporangium sp. NPDC049525]|uniref:hypothetical protein n=1 Tax=Dactylosporangium sp. NPDC049525 TaxID=3154730 RepID=UPI003425851F